MIRRVLATRYATPLREGGSLPAIVEADDLGMYVVKFRGAGQGPKALVAELVAGQIGQALGLPVPELVTVDVLAALGRNEPDPEIQDLLAASVGLNAGLDFLPGAVAFAAPVAAPVEAALAADVVWFDAFVTNVDRTPRNPNLLLWHGKLWLIDHGAAIYQHHSWSDPETVAGSRFAPIRDHILLPLAGPLPEADRRLQGRLTETVLRAILATVPDDWLVQQPPFDTPAAHREAYLRYFLARLAQREGFVAEAELAREARRNG